MGFIFYTISGLDYDEKFLLGPHSSVELHSLSNVNQNNPTPFLRYEFALKRKNK